MRGLHLIAGEGLEAVLSVVVDEFVLLAHTPPNGWRCSCGFIIGIAPIRQVHATGSSISRA